MPLSKDFSDPLSSIYAQDSRVGDLFKGKHGLIVGIANAGTALLLAVQRSSEHWEPIWPSPI
jgi:hypothetical protein